MVHLAPVLIHALLFLLPDGFGTAQHETARDERVRPRGYDSAGTPRPLSYT